MCSMYVQFCCKKCLFPRRSGETIQKSAILPTANERTFHIMTNPIAVDIVACNKHVYFGRTMELGGKFSDFEHFENALKNFSDETFQVFVIDDCKLISTANKMQTKKLPDKLKYAFVFYDLGLWLGSVGLGLVRSVCGVR